MAVAIRMSKATKATTADLWSRCYVAENADEAVAQAHRQLDDFYGKVIAVHSFTGWVDGDIVEVDLDPPIAAEIVGDWDWFDWDGDVLYPEWRLRFANPNRRVKDGQGHSFRLCDIEDLFYVPPGIGTREGFASEEANLSLPETS